MSSSPPDEASRLNSALVDAAARAGERPPLVLIDGPSGAGKSSLADLLVRIWPGGPRPQLVRMDDIYPGWSGLDRASAAVGPDLLEPFVAGKHPRWQRWDWAGDTAAEWHSVSTDRPLIVEGCGTLTRANASLADLAVWLDADDAVRKERALRRDGMSFATHWDQWQHDFDAYVLRESPRGNATLVLDVTTWPLAGPVSVTGQD